MVALRLAFLLMWYQAPPLPGSGGITIEKTPTWVTVLGGALAAWSAFWSLAPAPTGSGVYNILFHIAQWISFNPGRSIGVAKSNSQKSPPTTSGPGWR